MKKRRILFVALILCFRAFLNADAQTVNYKTTEYWYMYVYCNDEPEEISGQFNIHHLLRINKANYLEWAKTTCLIGEAVSQSTGEVFRVNYHTKHDPFLPGTIFHRTYHVNLMGDHGTHIIVAVTLEYDFTGTDYTTTITRLKHKCM